MRRAIIDLRSVLWTAIMAGKDKEGGRKVIFNDKEVHVNSAEYGYDNALDHILLVLDDLDIQPRDVILVDEGKNAKLMRTQMFAGYKAGREQCEDQYIEFNKAKEMLVSAMLNVGAQMCWQENMEADDVIAYLAQNLKGERWIATNDGDLAACIGGDIHLWQRGARDQNPFGPFDPKYITVYKALVGDSSDKYPGAYKFGEAAWNKLLDAFGEEGLELMKGLIESKRLLDLGEDVAELKELQRVIDSADSVYTCYALAKLYVEKVNVMRRPLQWRVGMVKPYGEEDRLKPWHSQVRLIHAGNYGEAVKFFRSKVSETPEFCIDLETYVGEESDEWLERRSKKGGGVDVIGSMITGCGITFGANQHLGYYVSACHADTDNVTYDQLRELLELIPKNKVTVAQNFAGFEAVVLFNHFGEAWKNNGWRGFFPNAVDSRIAASYWDEDAPSHGLKALSKQILDYDQETYAQVTTVDGVQLKMNQLSAKHVLSYGMDDVYCTSAIYNHFKVCMELEDTFDAFMRLEQKPMYLSAMSYVRGTDISLQRLQELKVADDKIYANGQRVLDAFLISKNWEGTVCPRYTELDAAAVKEIFHLVTGQELKTMVRTVSKLAVLVADAGFETLGALIAGNEIESLNQMVEDAFSGHPEFDVASPKQVGKLLYETMGLPVRLRNKATDVMRAKGIREGTARTDDDSIKMAQKMGDVAKDSPEYELLSVLMAMKSINTKRGLYYDPYPNMVHWKTGRIHPEMVQSSTNTRRWASRSPNIQQMDKDEDGIRSVILPHRRDAVVVSLDQSAQEIRLTADYSKDSAMMSCFIGNEDELRDVHSIVGCSILKRPYEDLRGKEDKVRSIAKTCAFASIYGAAAPKIAENLGISVDEAQGYLDAIYKQFPSLAKWKQGVEQFAERYGYVNVLGGTRRHLRKNLLSDNSYERSKALRQASNAMIQSAGANQIKMVMSLLWDSPLFENYDMRWMFCVHDEICFSVHKDHATQAIQEAHRLMLTPFLEVIPAASSIGFGRTFGALVELGEVFDAALVEKTLDALFDRKEPLAA